MTAANLLAWSIQIGLLIGICALVALVFRLRLPTPRLLYCQVTLLLAMALPLVQPWKHEVVGDAVTVSTGAVIPRSGTTSGLHIPWEQAAMGIIAAGVLCRAAWLGAGFWRLRQYRRRSRLLENRDGTALLISDEIASPVTFGARRPVVLLPAQFPQLDPRIREAILCHELLHVKRRDWLFTVAEELVRGLWWFHPAIWWLLGQIQLTREQVVDHLVIDQTHKREEYVDALLAMAGTRPQLDLAPAPLFLRQRHLKKRVVLILKEIRMSKTRLISSLAAGLGILIVASWLITESFPLAAAPDAVSDGPGVTVDLGGAALIHRSPVPYPDAARRQGIQGTVLLQVRLDSSGSVADAQVVSGPDELRKAALQSVLDWHFTATTGSSHTIGVSFQLPSAPAPSSSTPAPAAVPPTPPAQAAHTIERLTVAGLSDDARADLLSRLPVHEGESLTTEKMRQLVRAVRNFDEHLVVSALSANGDIVISLPAAQPPSRIRVGGNAQAMKLITQPKPMYPREAKEARIQGVVRLQAFVGKDGAVQNLNVISGHPLLVPAAIEAVRQWVYEPTLLNGTPIDVETQIDVNFTLSQ